VRVTDADAVCMHIMSIKGIIELRKYGVATSSRLFKIIGLFCRISSLLQGSFVKETYHFKEPTHHSHPICATQYASDILVTNRALLQKRPVILRSLLIVAPA